ncbi:MAG: pyrroloquinoline quinone biosynthesis peptide chaperone PqqD [Paracoccaceae bacterium]
MDQGPRRLRPVLVPASKPALPRHVRLRFDATRERWVILAPERVLVPDEISVEVLQLCDGQRSIEEVVAVLAAKFAAPPEMIQTDCIALLQDLADKGYLLDKAETQT